ncbi:cell division protein SepF [Actinomadura atramentaria]|uniref:cell division protein SepF n=1 Tax=Actinomadura atramentaria TaxID=1990 RepID=UPI0003A5B0DC|nr:cell division protein SepF [Actinomadura atramentaria]
MTFAPRQYDDIIHVGHFFTIGRRVVMDLSGLSDDEAKPMIDFASGLVFGRCGAMDRIAPKVFLLTPRGAAVPEPTGSV